MQSLEHGGFSLGPSMIEVLHHTLEEEAGRGRGDRGGRGGGEWEGEWEGGGKEEKEEVGAEERGSGGGGGGGVCGHKDGRRWGRGRGEGEWGWGRRWCVWAQGWEEMGEE
eukprot:966804-Rhodomonas_salina.2